MPKLTNHQTDALITALVTAKRSSSEVVGLMHAAYYHHKYDSDYDWQFNGEISKAREEALEMLTAIDRFIESRRVPDAFVAAVAEAEAISLRLVQGEYSLPQS